MKNFIKAVVGGIVLGLCWIPAIVMLWALTCFKLAQEFDKVVNDWLDLE